MLSLDDLITESRAKIMASNIYEALQKYQKKNKKALPEQIIIYRDGIGGPILEEKCLKTEL